MVMDNDALNPCGVEGHTGGHWVDLDAGIFYCPDCNTEVWTGTSLDTFGIF